jgi:hypothetical protein
MKTTLITSLFCIASMLLPCAHAQQGDAVTNQLTILRAKAEQGDAFWSVLARPLAIFFEGISFRLSHE